MGIIFSNEKHWETSIKQHLLDMIKYNNRNQQSYNSSTLPQNGKYVRHHLSLSILSHPYLIYPCQQNSFG